jgi:ribosomal-protein-alanine N-acetyltransferase
MNSLFSQSLTREHLPAIARLDTVCFNGLWSQEAYQREMDSPNSDFIGLFRQEASVTSLLAMGCAWAILDEAHITLLGVDPGYRGQGLGQWLLIQLLHVAIARQLSHATLEVRQSNQTAIALYEKFRFQTVGERKKYYTDGETALILWKRGLQELSTQAHLVELGQVVRKKLQQSGWAIVPPPCLPASTLDYVG